MEQEEDQTQVEGRRRGGAKIKWDASLVSSKPDPNTQNQTLQPGNQENSKTPPPQNFIPQPQQHPQFQQPQFQQQQQQQQLKHQQQHVTEIKSPRSQKESTQVQQKIYVYPPLPVRTQEARSRFKRNMACLIFEQLDGLHVDRSLCDEKVFNKYLKIKKEAGKKMDNLAEKVARQKCWFGTSFNKQQYQQRGKSWSVGDWKLNQSSKSEQENVKIELIEGNPGADQWEVEAKFGQMVLPLWQKEIVESLKQQRQKANQET
eukprot:TRINITY_DN8834_c0_g1_i1.p2 TRINITY_DN8834_c0_g1~~TRINITY_DN8834_c0_g1_i1.p2  ORF type:complete len:267 (+),score=31.64 TRINITY_DN8834_c0_g1_i1:23-802(+)